MRGLFLIQLLLIEQALCRTQTPPVLKTTPLSKTSVLGEGETIKKERQSLLGSQTQLGLPSDAAESAAPEEWVVMDEARAQSAQRIVTTLKAKLQGRILVQANTSCEELLSASTLQDPASALFPRELLGLSLVPVLVAAGCSREAQTLVLRMYNLLGVEDTEELLIEVETGWCPLSTWWIRQCQVQDEESPGASGRRARRSPQRNCINKKEEHVYNVVEWIPVVSTLYNLGTAVYYTSVNCSETAKERAILSAVDLGTDALMAVTGGTVGVAGYVAGAGVKTGVKAGIKYLLSSMKQEEDLIVNESDSIYTSDTSSAGTIVTLLPFRCCFVCSVSSRNIWTEIQAGYL
uniref:Apolipoprotein F n=1 Tax=Oncorhynchus kisutch TaxID=8019 RepID=A0A8C7CJ88_ONCKI